MARLLYVDDEESLLDIGKLFLEKGGEYSVETSPSAQEALELIRTLSFDAIISDYQMPGMDGIAFLQIIREQYGNIPFILFTGRGREEIVIEAINHGADFYLQKGGDPKSQFAELSHKIKHAIERRKALEAIRTNEEKYRELVENATTIILKSDKDGKITFFNEYAQQFFGYASDEILGRYMVGTIVPEEEADSGRDLVQLIDNIVHNPEKYTHNQNENITKNGQRVWINWWNKPLFDADGTITGMISIGTDITEERKITSALRESEEKFRMLVEQSFDGILILDITGIILFINNAAHHIIGADTIDDIIGTKNFFEIIIPSSRADFLEHSIQAGDEIERDVSRYQIHNLDFEEKWIDCISKQISFLDQPAILVSVRDVTLQHHAEISLRESNKKFSTVFHKNPVALALISAQTGIFVDINSALVKYSGYPREDILGKTADELCLFLNLDDFINYISNVHEDDFFEELVVNCRRKNGETATCRLHSNLLNMNGKPFILVSFQDITEKEEIDATHQMLVRSMVGTTGFNALKIVSETIISWIHADCVIIGEIGADKETIQIVYMLQDNREISGVTYSLKGKPCKRVIEKGFYVIHDNAAKKFPESKKLQDLNIRGYVGIALKNSKGETIGILCILSRTPLLPLPALHETLDIIAVKVSSEIERIQMERTLLENHRKLDNALDLAHMATWDYTVSSKMFTFDDRFYSLYGTTVEQEGGYNISFEEYLRMFVHPSDVHRVLEEIPKALAAKEPDFCTELEHRIIRRDGEIRYVIVRYSTKLDSNGNVYRIQGANQDITDRKRAEEALEKRIVALTQPMTSESGISFQSLFNLADIQRLQDEFVEATGVASIITHIDGTPITHASGFCRLCHDIIQKTKIGFENCIRSDSSICQVLSAGPVIKICSSCGLWDAGAVISVGGKPIACWLAGQIRDETQTEEQMRIYAREIGADEQVMVEAFREVPVMSRERFSKIAEFLYTLATQLSSIAYQNVQQARFITQRKDIEKALCDSESQYRNVVEDQTELICRFSPDGRLTFVNGAYCRYFGLDSVTCIGKPHSVLIPPEDLVLMKEAFSRITPARPIATIDNRVIMPDGSMRWQHWSDRAIFNNSGNVIEYQSVGMDITDRKQMEETFQEANKKLNLLTNITHHDIKNQMTALYGYLEILKTEVALPDEAQMYLEKTSDIVDTIRHQIEFTNIYQDLKKQQPRWQNLGESIQNAILDLDISHVQVSVSVSDVIMVYADPMFSKVFFNLIDNALHYGGPAMTRIVISTRVMGDFLVIACGDNGIGIANSEKDKIFERGYGKNSGLGLFLIREILGITGMTIQERGVPGKGSCFEINVPKGSWKSL